MVVAVKRDRTQSTVDEPGLLSLPRASHGRRQAAGHRRQDHGN